MVYMGPMEWERPKTVKSCTLCVWQYKYTWTNNQSESSLQKGLCLHKYHYIFLSVDIHTSTCTWSLTTCPTCRDVNSWQQQSPNAVAIHLSLPLTLSIFSSSLCLAPLFSPPLSGCRSCIKVWPNMFGWKCINLNLFIFAFLQKYRFRVTRDRGGRGSKVEIKSLHFCIFAFLQKYKFLHSVSLGTGEGMVKSWNQIFAFLYFCISTQIQIFATQP